jgi:hypothetical protein
MLCSEELPRHLGADLRPICRRDKIFQLSSGGLSCSNPLRDLDAEWADLASVNLERRTQLGRCPSTCLGQVSGVHLCQPLGGERMHAGAEERPHLLRGDRIPSVEAVDAGQTGADPASRSLSAFGVVRGQPAMTLHGGIQRCDLSGQVVVP